MRILVETGSLQEVAGRCLILPVWEGNWRESLGDLSGPLADLLAVVEEGRGFKGTFLETLPLWTSAIPRQVILLGLGKRADFRVERAVQAAGAAVRAARKARADRALLWMGAMGLGGLPPESLGEAFGRGAEMGEYRFTAYKAPKEEGPSSLEDLVLLLPEGAPSGLESALEAGSRIGRATAQVREWINLPSSEKVPEKLASRIREMAEAAGLQVQVLTPPELAELGAGGILAVGQGSNHPPRLAVLRWKCPEGTAPALALVGKGVTFDSGGISIKPANGMEEMISDMSGAATVAGAMIAIAEAGIELPVLAIMPMAENMPSGSSYRPGDILTMLGGKTVEVQNTDAEGRLILADALTYAARQGAERIIDLATLTGACVIALGHIYAGLVTNHEEWAGQVQDAAKGSGERIWPLPSDGGYREQIDSTVADLKNVGGRDAGTITAGLFLGEFVEGKPWVHLDIAGTAFVTKEKPYRQAGATGFGVATLVEVARRLAVR